MYVSVLPVPIPILNEQAGKDTPNNSSKLRDFQADAYGRTAIAFATVSLWDAASLRNECNRFSITATQYFIFYT